MMNPDGGKIREGIKAEWCVRDCPVVGESSWWGEWLKAASHVKIGGMPFWRDKFKGREGGKNLCAAIIVLLTESVPELPIWGLHVLLSSPFYVWEPRRVTVPLAPGNACGYWLPPWTLRGVYQFSSVQSLSRVRLFVTPWTAARQTSLFITNSWSLLKLMSVESVMPSNHLILCQSFLFAPSILPSIRVFSNESVLRIRWPKYWSFSFSISPSNEYSELISFRMDWLDLLAVQGTLKSLLQHHSSKASILQHSAFFIVQLSHPYTITGKTIALTRWTFVGEVMSLLFNTLSRLVIAFLPRSKSLLSSWL